MVLRANRRLIPLGTLYLARNGLLIGLGAAAAIAWGYKGAILGEITALAVILALAATAWRVDLRPRRPTWQTTRFLLRAGGPLLISYSLLFVTFLMDRVFVAAVLPDQLGQYTFASVIVIAAASVQTDDQPAGAAAAALRAWRWAQPARAADAPQQPRPEDPRRRRRRLPAAARGGRAGEAGPVLRVLAGVGRNADPLPRCPGQPAGDLRGAADRCPALPPDRGDHQCRRGHRFGLRGDRHRRRPLVEPLRLGLRDQQGHQLIQDPSPPPLW